MKIKAAYETETFINERGYYAIKQTDHMGDDSIIELTPDQMQHLIRDFNSHLGIKDQWLYEIEAE